MKSTIFLSYSSTENEEARRIELSLEGEGHSVFRDRSGLPPAETFDARIRAAVGDSDLFVFLISPESVSAGRYTLTELKFAEQKWNHPAGHVLPVLVKPTPTESIPGFLRAVTILQPSGDVAAEVAAEVDRLTAPWWRWLLRPQGLAVLVLLALLVAGGTWQGVSRFLEHREQSHLAAALVQQGRLQADSGNYANAWKLLERANAIYPDDASVVDAQERLAMDWLDHARGSQLNGNLKDIAEKVLPVLSRGATTQQGQRAADLLAHMGWADFLRSREGVGGLDPVRHYRRAIEIDPKNSYAHTMWGFEILRKGSSLSEARQHFAIALDSGREREYIRHMQIAALLWAREPERESEAICVANEIRTSGETMPVGLPDAPDVWKLWNIYYDRVINGSDKTQFLTALPPADHLATFRWLYPEEQFPKEKYLYLYILAQLQELSGDRTGALASYRSLQAQLTSQGMKSGRMVDDAGTAIKRLSGQ